MRAIDNHAHVVRPVDGDTDYDALPFSLLDPPPPGSVAAPASLRNDYRWFVRAWQALYRYPWEETGWVASQTAREALTRALSELIADGTITRARASEIGRLVLRDNAKKLYGF